MLVEKERITFDARSDVHSHTNSHRPIMLLSLIQYQSTVILAAFADFAPANTGSPINWLSNSEWHH